MITKLIKKGIRSTFHGGYRIMRPAVFCFNSERVHVDAIALGEMMGKSRIFQKGLECLIRFDSSLLSQTVAGIHFSNPLGLAAGFDYEARLTQVTKGIGFGFGTVGTITNLPYEGNKRPRLGRLVRSRSLVVNKGFKNLGIEATLARLGGLYFPLPVGISIGKTNTLAHTTQQEGIDDIVNAFTILEKNAKKNFSQGSVPFSYYELNISCPNLHGPVEFYSPVKLEQLLSEVFKIKLTRPVFIKMPIVKTNEETLGMLTVISRFPVVGIIIGNLSGDRNHPALVKKELESYPKGGLSGMATQARSDELIGLAYRKLSNRFIIIGCGGVFNAIDAYRKIRSGATLVQFITGMIFEGPQLPASINADLVTLLKKDGFKNISEAVGADFK